MRRLLAIFALTLFVMPVPHGRHAESLPDGSVAVTEIPTGRVTLAPESTLASYAVYPRPSSLANLQYRQVIEVHNPGPGIPRPVTVTLDLHDVAYRTTLVLADSSGNIVPFQVLSYVDSDSDDRLESATIVFIANIPSGGDAVYFLYYDNSDESTPIHNSNADYVNEIYGLTASFGTRSGSSGSLSSSRTGISVSRTPVYQNDAIFGSSSGSASTVIGSTITVTIGTYRFVIYATPKFVYQGSFDYDSDGSAETADGYTFREGLQVIQYRDGSQRVDIVRYEPTFAQGSSYHYGYTVDILSPFVFESHAFVLDTDGDGDVGDTADPSSADPSGLKSYVDPGNPFTIHIDSVTITLGPVMIKVAGQAFVVPMNVLSPAGLVGNNNYESFTPNFSFLREDVAYTFYYNLPYVDLYRKLVNTGSSDVRLSDSFSFLNAQPLLHHTNVTSTILVNDPFGYPGDTTSDAGTFFQIHTRYDVDNVPPYTSADIARPRAYGLADILGTSPSEKYVYLGRSSEAPNRDPAYPPAIIGMILVRSSASGLSLGGSDVSDPFGTFYSRSITYGRIYDATTNRYDTDGQYATASIGLVRTDNTGFVLSPNGYIEGEVLYAIYYGSAATPSRISDARSMLSDPISVTNDPSGPSARQSYRNITVRFVDYQGDPLAGASVSVSLGGTEIASAATDSDGAITLRLGANGTYTFEVSYGTVYGTLAQSFEVYREVNASNAAVTLVAAIQDVDVYVRYPDDSPADAVTLTIYGVNSTYAGQTTEELLYNITLSSGYYHVENLPEGYYRLVITKYFGPVKVTEEHVVAVNATEYSFVYYLDVARLSVSVSDPDGSPVAGAAVSVQVYDGTGYSTLYTASTGSDGSAEFFRIPLANQTSNEPIRVVASYTLYGVTATESVTVTLTADSSASITLGLYDLTVNVYDSEGIPAANGTIEVLVEYSDGQTASFSFSTYSFTIENLPSAAYTSSNTITLNVTYRIFDVADRVTATVSFTADTSVNVNLDETRSVSFEVGYYGDERVPLAGATVKLYTPGGFEIASISTNSSGQAVFRGIPRASGYVAKAYYAFYGVPIKHVTSFDNAEAGTSVRIAYNVVTLTIHVRASSGEDVPGAIVDVYFGDTLMLEVTTNSSGYAAYFPFPSAAYLNNTNLIVVSYTTYGRLVTTSVSNVNRDSAFSVTLSLGRIEGSVSLADGRSEIAARISVAEQTATGTLPVTNVETATGSFSVAYLPLGKTYVITAEYETSYGVTVSATASVTLTNVSSVSILIPVGTVGAHVVDAQGNAVSGATVVGVFGGLSVSAATDSAGYAYFYDVPLSAAIGVVTFEASYELFGISVTDSTTASVSNGSVVELALDMGSTKVYVYDADGNALSGASVSATIGSVTQTKTTDASGKASFYLPIGATVEFEASYKAPNGAEASAAENVTIDLSDVTITIPLGTINVEAKDLEGEALSGIAVRVSIGAFSLSGTTDASGKVSFYVPVDVEATISAEGEFGVTKNATVSLVAGGSYSITLDLGRIYVHVLDADNADMSDIPVSVSFGYSVSGHTNASGIAELYVPIGLNATISARYTEYGLVSTLNVTLSLHETYNVTIPVGTITVKVSDAQGRPIAGADVTVNVLGYARSASTGSTGEASFYVPVGVTARIEAAYAELGVEDSESFALSPGGRYEIVLNVGYVTVRVVDYESASLAGASVSISIGTLSLSGSTNSSGMVSIYAPLETATVKASYDFAGVPISETETIALSAGSVYTIALPLGHVYVEALTYDGVPISGADAYVDIGSIHLEASTNSSGIAEFYSLVNVTATVTVYFTTFDVYDSNDVYLEAGSVYRFYLPLSHITVFVSDYDGHAITGANVVMDVLNYHYEGSTVNGSLVIPTVVNATATIRVSYLTIYGFELSVARSVELAPNGTYGFVIPMATFSVVVYDALNEALPAAEVSLGYNGTIFVVTSTDSSGRVTIIQVPVGKPIDVRVAYKTDYGYEAKYYEQVILSGPSEKSVVLPLGELSLNFEDLAGNAVSGVKLTISYGALSTIVSVSGNNVTLERFPIGKPFNFTASKSVLGIDVIRSSIISLGAASESYVIALPMKPLTISVVDLRNEPISMARITLSYEAVGVFFSGNVLGGTISFEELPVGAYLGKLSISADYLSTVGVAVSKTVVVESPATQDEIIVKLDVKPVSILVTDVNGEPTTATVYIKGISTPTSIVVTASNGTVYIPDLPLSISPTNVTAVKIVQGSNGVTLNVKASIVADFSTSSEVQIALPLTDVSITVTDRNGNPLEGAIVTLQAGNLEFKATTDASGKAVFEDVPTLGYLGISEYRVIVDYGGVKTETTLAGTSASIKAKTPSDVQRQRVIASIIITAAVAGFVAYKFVLKARPPYYRLKKAISKGAEEIDLDRLPTRDEELLELFGEINERFFPGRRTGARSVGPLVAARTYGPNVGASYRARPRPRPRARSFRVASEA